ncbi:hypothetical protein CH063_03430 [Colletotrichum higginsianum]|uniref:Uncharacterized protein n=1 Tax=Colletotrichum higginsianum (strain IMI 349063) TaxID=759273 RepID=H1VX30_COLHI|nr:hypothetical protein CH063_03430 [Colletotrichum higginsianum]
MAAFSRVDLGSLCEFQSSQTRHAFTRCFNLLPESYPTHLDLSHRWSRILYTQKAFGQHTAMCVPSGYWQTGGESRLKLASQVASLNSNLQSPAISPTFSQGRSQAHATALSPAFESVVSYPTLFMRGPCFIRTC